MLCVWMHRHRAVRHMVLLRTEWQSWLACEHLADWRTLCQYRFGSNPDSTSVLLATCAECHSDTGQVCTSRDANRIYKHDFVAGLDFLMEATEPYDLT